MSHVHRPDGRLRLAATLTISAAAALTPSLLSLSAMLLVALLGMAWIAINRRIVIADFVRRFLRINVFLAIVWLTVSIDWRHFGIDEAGALLAAQMSLRVNIVTLAASMLLIGMSGLDLGRAAVGLGLPVALGALLAQLTRQLSLLSDTKARLDTAMRARAYQPKFGFRTLQVSAQMVAWLIVHALTKAERLSLGLRSRGWNTTRWPIRENTPWRSLPKSDWSILGAVAIIIAACLLIPNIGAHG